MWHQMLIPVLIPTLIIRSHCDVNNTDNSVFIRYGGHAEAGYANEISAPTTTIKVTEAPTTTPATTTTATTKAESTTKVYEEETEGVIFVPNNKQPARKDDEDYDGNNMRIKDIMLMKNINDAMNKDFHMEKPNDKANEDIVFITGKNHEIEKTITKKANARRTNAHYEHLYGEEEFTVTKRPKLKCDSLDCNNAYKPICGAKILNKEWRYRLFLNDCYFRKVNCGFKYEDNRYKIVPIGNCKTIGAHAVTIPFSFKPKSLNKPTEQPQNQSRRALTSSRRSMTMYSDGKLCTHPCPVSCPDDYDPQCAISGTGQRRVFVNHCKLDLNSCFYSVVWHQRPLADCVGAQKADLRHNRGFIGWMQRVGIVDGRGRIVLE